MKMRLFQKAWQRLAPVARSGRPYGPRTSTRPLLEVLEDRSLPSANLALTLTGAPSAVSPGALVTYNVVVNNQAGTSAAMGTTLTDRLPLGLQLIAASSSQGTVTAAGNTVTANLGSLAAGSGNATIAIEALVANAAAGSGAGSVTDTVTVHSPDNTGTTNSASTTTTINPNPAAAADVSVQASANPIVVNPGQNITYTFTVHNNSPTNTATGVTLIDALPSGVTYVSSADSNGGTINHSGNTVTDNIGSLAPGATQTVTVTATPTKTGTLTNTTTVTSDGGDTNTANNQVVTTAIALPPGFGYDPVTKTLTITGMNFIFGQTITAGAGGVRTVYTFTIDGNTVTLPDTLIAHVVVNGTGSNNTAVLYTLDNDTGEGDGEGDGEGGNGHRTEEIVVFVPGGGEIFKFNGNNAFVFLQLNNFNTGSAFLGKADLGEIFGSTDEMNGFLTNGIYSTMESAHQFHFIWGSPFVYGYAERSDDWAEHEDGSGPSNFVVSGTSCSSMAGTDNGLAFFNEAIGFRYNTGKANHSGDTAVFYDSPANDIFLADSDGSSMLSYDSQGRLQEFDQAEGFASDDAYSFVGGSDYDFNHDHSHHHAHGYHEED